MLKSPIFLVGDFFCLSLYGNQITNIMTTLEFYTEELSKRKTIGSKKAFLTNAISYAKDNFETLKRCKERSGFYLGKKVTPLMELQAERELRICTELREELN